MCGAHLKRLHLKFHLGVSHAISFLGLNTLHRTIARLSKQTEVPTCREKIRRPVLSGHLCAGRGPTSTPHRSGPENSLRHQA